ncbi:MAG: hypothetical protein ACT6RL_19510 [Neoaquamicrobium sediminum]|uniref:hypothetical protein n=1 Tax=Neoaquamicrobium sediminum TaxID=1849104 RepID=UPI0040351615
MIRIWTSVDRRMFAHHRQAVLNDRAIMVEGSIGAVYGRLSVGKGFLSLLQVLVGAAMYPTFRCGLSCAAGHNAIRASQVPIVCSHSKCAAPVGFHDPAVSTGFVH